ncbi:MAG TPA: thiamine pyrophosphate-binding protein [Casimicrobiaceae bacterium]|nr:thiamine pyrophosphate-binding protein [Casimicrobiaceae bacterium]
MKPPIERPAGPLAHAPAFGSDAIADTLRALALPYIALNPGASFRGLEDSLVNHLGNERPTMLLCLHEESAVAIAHGYAKVTGKPMAVAVHSNVGLMHASMAIFNAWCDRMPVVVIGATGPVDAPKRRPWIDWIHTVRDQGALVRHFVKWDDQPASPAAAREALLRAHALAQSAPMAPVYVNLDAEMQEASLAGPLSVLDPARFAPARPASLSDEQAAEAVRLLRRAKRGVMLAGRVSRHLDDWNARVDLAERLGLRVVTDLKVGAGFPTDHPLHVGAPGIYPVPAALEAIRDADAILSLDWVDLAGTIAAATGSVPPKAKVVHCSLDSVLVNGWSMDHQALPAVDLAFAVEPDIAVRDLLRATEESSDARKRRPGIPRSGSDEESAVRKSPVDHNSRSLASLGMTSALSIESLAAALGEAACKRDVSLTHLPLGWNGASWHFRHPLDYIGFNGGGGVGAGPGISVGAALALRGSGRLPVGVLGDGDFLMGVTALWTAAHYRIPLLILVANNRSFYNDEIHQERMARARKRPVENRWIGQRLTDPDIDIAGLARAQGCVAFGPIVNGRELARALREAIAAVERGAVAVLDVRVEPGYTPAMATKLASSAKRAAK